LNCHVFLGESHRARIPAEINLRVRLGKKPPPDLYRQYRLDMRNGKTIADKNLALQNLW